MMVAFRWCALTLQAFWFLLSTLRSQPPVKRERWVSVRILSWSSGNLYQVTTLEGLLQRTISGLSQDQPVRRALHPEDAEKIDEYIERVEQLLTVAKPFELTVVDPSGNSWVENPHAPAPDSGRVEEWFERSREEDNLLGLYSQEQIKEEYEQDEEQVTPLTEERLQEEVPNAHHNTSIHRLIENAVVGLEKNI